MSTSVVISAKYCLKWNVEKPFCDTKRESPKFSYLGIKWYLTLKKTNVQRKFQYTLTLCTEDRIKEFNKNAWLLVLLQRPKSSLFVSGGCKAIKNSSLDNCLEIQTPEDDCYGNWKVYCIFSSNLRTELHIELNNTLHVISTLTVQSDLLDSSNIIRKAKLAAIASDDSVPDEENLSTDFGKLLEQQWTSDITLTCGENTFYAHRIILAARSEVFAAMFRSKMIESETGSIDIKGIDSEVFELLLKYVYTGKIPNLSVDIASSLYIAADKYSVHSLKNKCSKWMLENVTEENCLEFLFVADTWNDAILKDRLVNFVAEILLLLERDEWQTFCDKYPKLANSVYEKRVFTKTV